MCFHGHGMAARAALQRESVGFCGGRTKSHGQRGEGGGVEVQWQRQGWRGKKLEELVKWWADSAFTWSVLALAAAEESACGLERRRSFGTIKSRIRPTYYLKAYQTTANMHPQTRGQNEGEGRGRGEVFIVAHGSGFGKAGTRLALGDRAHWRL